MPQASPSRAIPHLIGGVRRAIGKAADKLRAGDLRPRAGGTAAAAQDRVGGVGAGRRVGDLGRAAAGEADRALRPFDGVGHAQRAGDRLPIFRRDRRMQADEA